MGSNPGKDEGAVKLTYMVPCTIKTNWVRAHQDQGGDLETLKTILGHAKLAITADLYVHVPDDTKIAGMKKMDKV